MKCHETETAPQRAVLIDIRVREQLGKRRSLAGHESFIFAGVSYATGTRYGPEMGLFDKLGGGNGFGKKKQGSSTPQDDGVPTVGWDAITAACAKVHGDRKEHHFGTIIKHAMGGPDPLDGVSIFVANDHWHYVTYGMSELYEKASDDHEHSGWGFEFTMRVAHSGGEGIDGVQPPMWPIELMQSLARYVFGTGAILHCNDHIDVSNITASLGDSVDIPAMAVRQDPLLGEVTTPNGVVEFRQLVTLTEDEIHACKMWNTQGILGLLARNNPMLIATPQVDRQRFDEAMRAEVEVGADAEGSSYANVFAADLSIDGDIEDGSVEVSFAPLVRSEVAVLLRRRLGFGRGFWLLGNNVNFGFVPADAATGELTGLGVDEGGDVFVRLSTADALALSVALRASEAAGGPAVVSVPGIDRLTLLIGDDSFYQAETGSDD
jgi:suppressor of fused